MKIRLLTDSELGEVYQKHLRSSFPASELRPLHSIRALVRDGVYHTWGLLDGEQIVGEAFVWEATPGWGLFDYLCVAPERRNDGLGAVVIKKLLEAERGKVLFGESEVPQYAPNPAMAQRRLAFYKRNGAQQAGYDTAIFGVPYHTLFWADGPISEEQLIAAHRAAYRSRFPETAYHRFIHIPWDITMGMPEQLPWEE